MHNAFAASCCRRIACLVLVGVLGVWSSVGHGQTRARPPSGEALAAAKRQVAEIYRQDYDRARTSDEKRELAVRMYADARGTRDNPTGKYAVYQVARDVAVAGGDLELTLSIVEQAATDFAIDAPQWADEALARLGKRAREPQDVSQLMQSLSQLAGQAVRRDQYDIAQRIGKVALQLARDLNDRVLIRELEDRLAAFATLARRYEEVRPAFEVLETKPVDPDANLAAGRFRCLVQDRWAEGLPMLALGNDPVLAKLARAEIAEPTETTELLRIADRWWELADAKGPDQSALRRHAFDGYLATIGQLEGITRQRLESRLREVERWVSKNAVYLPFPLKKVDAKQPPLASLLNESEKFYSDAGTEFAFQIPDPAAYIVIDLKREVPISRVYIENRPVNDRTRGMRMFFSLSASDRGHLVWTAPDNAAHWEVRPPRVITARFITLARDPEINRFDGWLHLRKVKVFGLE